MADWDGERWLDEGVREPRKVSRARRVFDHSSKALLEGALISMLVVGLVAGTAFAGKGGGHKGGGGTTGGGTLAVVVLNSSDSVANWGESVTYNESTTATVYPYVSTTCTQNRTVVLSTSAGFYDSYAWPSARIVPLKTDRWTGGAADCVAKLYSMDGGSKTVLTSVTFHVDP
jgi:hypothetical protein